LFIVWIGANNYLGMPDDRDQAVHDVTLGIQRNLERLANKGAKTIMVMNLPDLGRTPLAEDPEVVLGLTQFTELHNLALQQHMNDLRAAYPDVKWVYVDVKDKFADMLDNPGTYGFTNTTGTCYEAAMDRSRDQPMLRMVAKIRSLRTANVCDGYLFFDPVHPTLEAHRVMADYAKEVLDEAGVAFGE
jgi:phospholipase/lecithinase/hemolysin